MPKKTDYSDFSYLGKPASFFLEKMKKGMRISPGFKRVWSDYMRSKKTKKAKKTADEIMVDNFVQIDELEKKVRKAAVSPSVPYSPSYSVSPSISNTPSVSDSYSLSREADEFDEVSVSPSEEAYIELQFNDETAIRLKSKPIMMNGNPADAISQILIENSMGKPIRKKQPKQKKRDPLPSLLETPKRRFQLED